MPEIRGKIVPVIARHDQTVNIHWLQDSRPEIVEARAFPKPIAELDPAVIEAEAGRRLQRRGVDAACSSVVVGMMAEYAIELVKRDRDGRL